MSSQGTYVIFLEAKKDVLPTVGNLGKVHICKGIYAYVGSALGKSVNLDSRVSRHEELSKKKKGNLKWHIDYVTTAKGIELTGFAKVEGKAIECDAAALLEKSGGKMVAKGFGSSDCNCKTHFFSINNEAAENFIRHLPDLF